MRAHHFKFVGGLAAETHVEHASPHFDHLRVPHEKNLSPGGRILDNDGDLSRRRRENEFLNRRLQAEMGPDRGRHQDGSHHGQNIANDPQLPEVCLPMLLPLDVRLRRHSRQRSPKRPRLLHLGPGRRLVEQAFHLDVGKRFGQRTQVFRLPFGSPHVDPGLGIEPAHGVVEFVVFRRSQGLGGEITPVVDRTAGTGTGIARRGRRLLAAGFEPARSRPGPVRLMPNRSFRLRIAAGRSGRAIARGNRLVPAG